MPKLAQRDDVCLDVSGDFSMATMTRSTAVLTDNGRCALSQTSQVAGGNSDVTADTGEDGNAFRGTWSPTQFKGFSVSSY